MAITPASIRYKNPGAMWGNALAIKWGASPKAVTLNDGKGQGNNIAVFPTYVQGICAQLDLWRSSKNYKNKKFSDAIRIWSGGNSVEQYISFVLSKVPGMKRDTVMDDTFWRSPMGIAFLKAQAWHEAGRQYPAPDEDWITAQQKVMGPQPSVPAVAGTGVVVGSAGAVAVGTVTYTLWDHITAHGLAYELGASLLLGFIALMIYAHNHKDDVNVSINR